MATKKPSPVVAAPATVINLATARKKRKLTGEDRKNAVDFARSMVGYNDSSPIWGKRLIAVLAELSDQITELETDAITGVINTPALAQARTIVSELQKRVAFGQIMKAQS